MGQTVHNETLRVGFGGGSQSVAKSQYVNIKITKIFMTGAMAAGLFMDLPAATGIKNYVADRNNAYPVAVRRGTETVVINPGDMRTLETDGGDNGLEDVTGSPALEGFSDETPLPDAGNGDPGSSVYPARSDHVHPADGTLWETVTHADSPKALLPGGRYDFDTTGGAITGILVGDPAKFDEVFIRNSAQSFASFALTVARNGHTIMNLAEDMTFNTDGIDDSLWFNVATWQFPGAQL
jgi:hypothetical protein